MSSISRASSPKNMANDYDESAEESGWTTYFEDFFNNQNNNIDGDNNYNNNNNHHNNGSMNFSGVDSSSSLVSDAASLAARKLDGDNNLQGGEEELSIIMMSKTSNRSSFGKRRKKIKTAFLDDALEDTASSPLNSPKVLYENQLHKANQKEQRDPFQEKGNSSSGQGDDERKEEFGFDGRDSDCTELKTRGLCLVPLSMVLKYLG